MSIFSNEVKGKYKVPADKIIDLVNSSEYKALQLITGRSFFVICGVSGSGKTTSIDMANEKLPSTELVAESHDLLFLKNINKNVDELKIIMEGNKYHYEGCRHIAYSIVKRELGEELMSGNICPVIFID